MEEACEIEQRALVKIESETDEQFNALKSYLKDSWKLSIVIQGKNGEQIIEYDESVFSSANLPNSIVAIYFDCKSSYQARRNNLEPSHWFILNFDFSKPLLMDWQNPMSAPTPNASRLIVKGNEDAWIAAVRQDVIDTLNQHDNHRAFLHGSFFYDYLVWIIGFPFAFFVTAKAVPTITRLFSNLNMAVEVAAYLYVFAAVLIFFRILFGYTKWAFPKMELLGDAGTTSGHRKFWAAVMASLVAAIIIAIFQT